MKSKTFTLYAMACLFLAAWIFSQATVTQSGQERTPQTPVAEAPPPCLGKFVTHEEAEEFLRTAKIIKSKGIPKGMALPQKITLEKDGRQEYGVFKSIDDRKPGVTVLPYGPELDFKDSWKFEVGAYELDKLLSLNMIPPTVERFYNKKMGSLQLWIENCNTEEERIKKNMAPPDPTSWREQTLKIYVFDNLIYNIDRNQGNILITGEWKMILIDHSRAFKNNGALRAAKDLTCFSLSLMKALDKLDEKSMKEHAGKYLTGYEIRAMLERRDKILTLYRKVADASDAVYP
jgi:hypothetical protein